MVAPSGNVGAWRVFAMPEGATMAEVYAQHVVPLAIDCAREILDRMAIDPSYVGVPLASGYGRSVAGRHRPALRQDWLAFAWEDAADDIVRKIHAAGFGVRTELAGQPVSVYDAHPNPGQSTRFRPGEVLAHRDGAALVGVGDHRGIWIGHAKIRSADGGRGLKLPAAHTLRSRLHKMPESVARLDAPRAYQVVRYRRVGQLGWIHAAPYNGAASTAFCGRLLAALRYAAEQDTTAIAVSGGRAAWNNGIHLRVIEAADDPRAEAWENIRRIDDVAEVADRLLEECLPTSPTTALRLGLVDAIGPDDPAAFDRWARELAAHVAADPPQAPPPMDTAPYRDRELADMWRDIFEDRHGFQARRRRFLGLSD